MSSYFTEIISAKQLSLALLDKTFAKNLIILDASIPPVGTKSTPNKCWPKYAIENAKRFDLEHNFWRYVAKREAT